MSYRDRVSHRLTRARALREIKAGRMRASAVREADPLLIAASSFHGLPADVPCPLCGEELRYVRWIYGEKLGRRSGTARSEEEIAEIAQEVGPVTVHLVEVCRACEFNYLVESMTAIVD
ncbi:hypothetical protein FHE74_09680 [Corynebacterium tapiri]|uniref:DUF5318 domain-containing protein n=1 Tax=Corynebacterium tapiri TaxID=1448266 RepID=A0A5C4U2F5_9CORY|nr:hypothetical protein FHE74_09680 [Corynebacterium tapiri]